MKNRDFVRLYRKTLHRPVTIAAILILVTFLLSLQTNEGSVLGEFTDFASNQQLPIPAIFPIFVNKSEVPEGITANSVIILNSATHTALYAKNAEQRFAPASLTKIAAALVVLENMDLSQIVTVPADISEKTQGSLMGLLVGEKITVENLLWGMLVSSGNDAAQTLAVNFPGGSNAFIEKMNELVSFLHLANTHFTNPMGFDDENHFSAAYDLAVLSEYALRNPLFTQIVSTLEKTVISEPFKNNQQWHQLKNTNELLGKINAVTGIKTGYTNAAGECMIISLNREGEDIIIVVLGSQDRLKDAEILINWSA